MVRKPIDCMVGRAHLNPCGGELFRLTGIIPGAEKGGIPYPSQMESQFHLQFRVSCASIGDLGLFAKGEVH